MTSGDPDLVAEPEELALADLDVARGTPGKIVAWLVNAYSTPARIVPIASVMMNELPPRTATRKPLAMPTPSADPGATSTIASCQPTPW